MPYGLTAIPAVKTNLFGDILCSWDHRSYPLVCKRKENARVKSAVQWGLIDFVEAVRDYLPIKAYRLVRRHITRAKLPRQFRTKMFVLR